jgi:hypothetical protein
MNHKKKRSKTKRRVLRVWTYPQAEKALPYVTSVMQSLREHWLEAQRHEARARRVTAQPGRPDRTQLIAQEEALADGQRAKERFNEAYQELQNIEVFCVDPVQGVGVIPFVQDEKLAWLIYDLFEPKAFRHWRYHEDPLDKRRPITEVTTGPAVDGIAI